jgi:hypothetical protein
MVSSSGDRGGGPPNDTQIDVVYEEGVPPEEHTREVRGHDKKPRRSIEVLDTPVDDGTALAPSYVDPRSKGAEPEPENAGRAQRAFKSDSAPAQQSQPRDPPPSKEPERSPPVAAPVAKDPAEPRRPEAPPVRSAELAASSIKERKRARDQRAEKSALRLLLFVFLGIGGGALVLVNSGVLDGDPHTTAPEGAKGATGITARARPQPKPGLRSSSDETPDIPAIRSMLAEGLTIGAEGLPQIAPEEGPLPPPALAGIESCRFAYGVWEFSPNKAVRFLSTCPVLEGEVLVGAYEVDGSSVMLSPLRGEEGEFVSVFEVEKPSSMTTRVIARTRVGEFAFQVKQRVTIMRPGLDGEAFRKMMAPKNTIEVKDFRNTKEPGAERAEPEPSPPPRSKPAPKAKAQTDPVLELLK